MTAAGTPSNSICVCADKFVPSTTARRAAGSPTTVTDVIEGAERWTA